MPIDPDLLAIAYQTEEIAQVQVDPELMAIANATGMEEADKASAVDLQKEQMYKFAQRELEGAPSAYLRTATRKIGATVAGLGARVLGYEETADKLHRLAGAYTQAHSEKVERELPWGVSHVMKAGTEITAQAPVVAGTLMTGAGAAGLIAQASVTTADAAYTEAKDAGKSKREAAYHATAVGLIEGGATAAFQAVGLGGVEKVLGKGGSKAATAGVKGTMKRLGITIATELPEEVSINFAQSFVLWYDRVDPGAMNPERLKSSTADVILQTILTAGAYSAPSLAAGGITTGQQEKIATKVAAKRAKITEIASEGRAPTRSEWTELGFSKWTARDAGQRQAMVEDMAAVVQEQDAAAEPVIDAEVVPQEEGPAVQVDPELLAIAQEAPRVAGIEPDAAQVEQQGLAAEDTTQQQAAPVEAVSGLLEGEAMTDALGEQVAPQEEVTGIHKKIAEEIRAGLDLPGLEGQAPQTQVQWLGKAGNRMRSDPRWIGATIRDVIATPRNLTAEEAAGFNLELAKLNNEINTQAEKTNSDDPVEAAIAESRSDDAIAQVDALLTAAASAGTEWGRAGVAMQMVLREDFSIGRLSHLEKTAKGAPLTVEEEGELRQLARRNAELEAQAEIVRKDAQELIDLRELTKAIGKAKGKAPTKRKVAAKKRAKESTETFRAATKNLMQFGSPDVKAFLKGESGAMKIPAEIIDACVEVVKSHVDLGVVTFAEFWANAKPDVGMFEDAKESFSEAWNQVGVEVDPIKVDDVSAIRNHASRMIEAVVRGGETDLGQVVADVQVEMQKVCEGFTKRQTTDAITRQGPYTVTKQQASKARLDLAEVKKQLRLQGKLDAIEEGKDPSAREAGKPVAKSAEEVSLRNQIASAEAASPVVRRRRANQKEKAYLRQLEQALENARDTLANVGSEKVAAKPEAERSEEARHLQFEIAQVRQEIEGRRAQHKRNQRSRGRKAFDATVETVNLARTIVTCVDLPLLRQGMFGMAAHPIKTGTAAVKIVPTGIIGVLAGRGWKKGLTAERAYTHAEDIKARGNYQQAKRTGLVITEVAGGVSKQEEVYVGHILKKFEGTEGILGWLAEPLARSERAYTMILNEIRMDAFDNMAATLGKDGTVTDAQAKVISNFANITSGRGSLWVFENSAVGMAMTFFAPRYVTSRFQLSLIEPVKLATGVGHEEGTRALLIKEYGRAAAGLASFLSAIALFVGAFGDEEDYFSIETDPRSTDFLKTKIGNRRLDLFAGLSQTLVLIARVAWNIKTTAKGKRVDLFRPDYAGDSAFDVVADHGRSKLAPWLSTTIDYKTGENIVGQDVSLLGRGEDEQSALLSLFVPFTFGDIKDVWGEKGTPVNALSTTLALLGMSLQTYDVESKQKGVVPNPFWGQDEADWEE